MPDSARDEHWMRAAIRCAQQAEAEGEVPVGAILVLNDDILAEGWNRPIGTHDPSAHAEILALRAGGQALRNYRLPATTLYVTLEPCAMCMTALVHARVARVVYGAVDEKRGAAVSALQLAAAPFLNHRISLTGGVLASECQQLLTRFFRERRRKDATVPAWPKNAPPASAPAPDSD